MRDLVLVLSVIASVSWIPVVRFFWRNWRERHHPISLANVGASLGGMYAAPALWLFVGSVDRHLLIGGISVLVLITGLSFQWAWWSAGRFLGTRKGDGG